MEGLLSSCLLCPHRCGVNRLKNERGVCGAGRDIRIYGYGLHKGEEPPISAGRGSGAVFFSYCSGRCVYCQNYKFSQLNEGRDIQPEELSEIMLALQAEGARNINLVTPTHFVPQIIKAAGISKRSGLSIPVIYNTMGYELTSTLKLLEGVVDIYVADMRYNKNEYAEKYSGLSGYVHCNRAAVKMMHRQAGTLRIENGEAKKGLIIRHLVMPCGIGGTEGVMRFIKEQVSVFTYISLMSQYYPAFCADRGMFPEISRTVSTKEYEEAVRTVTKAGLSNGWFQDIPGEKERRWFMGTNLSGLSA